MSHEQILSALREGRFTAVVGDVMDTLGLTRRAVAFAETGIM